MANEHWYDTTPPWVSNERKFMRAVTELRKNNLSIEEDSVRALYKKYGGLELEMLATTASTPAIVVPTGVQTGAAVGGAKAEVKSKGAGHK